MITTRASRLRCLSIVALCAAGASANPAIRAQGEAALVPERLAHGVISTLAVEHDVAFTPDERTVFFSRRTGRWGEPGQHSTIYEVSRFAPDLWGAPVPATFSGTWNDGDVFVSPDGRGIVFVSERPAPDGTSPGREIWMTERTAAGWSAPRHLGEPVSSPGLDMGPALAANGTLYFSSDRPGGHGAGDLYRARLRDGAYTRVENLGPVVNGPSGEWNVTVAPDESFLVFESSGRPGSLGPGGDLYLAYAQPGGWTEPIHLAAISTPGSDLMPRISPDGRRLYYATSWTRGGADTDIVSVPLEPLLARYPLEKGSR